MGRACWLCRGLDDSPQIGVFEGTLYADPVFRVGRAVGKPPTLESGFTYWLGWHEWSPGMEEVSSDG